MPTEGDCVLFEGKSFFLVDDYNSTSHKSNKTEESSSSSSQPSRPSRAQRRMSIEFSPPAVGDNARSTRSRSRPRRLSLLPISSMDEATVSTGRKLALEPMNTAAAALQCNNNSIPSRKPCRRFSLERVNSSSLSQNNGSVSANTAGYVLKQLSSF